MSSTFEDLRSYTTSLTNSYSCEPSEFSSHNLRNISDLLSINGFAVIPQVINSFYLDTLNNLYQEHILNSSCFIRRMDGCISQNSFNEYSCLINPISNIQLQPTFRHTRGIPYTKYLIEILTNSWFIAQVLLIL